VVLETMPLSTFLYHDLKERHVPVECSCARHAKGVLANTHQQERRSRH
jgi:transposase